MGLPFSNSRDPINLPTHFAQNSNSHLNPINLPKLKPKTHTPNPNLINLPKLSTNYPHSKPQSMIYFYNINYLYTLKPVVSWDVRMSGQYL